MVNMPFTVHNLSLRPISQFAEFHSPFATNQENFRLTKQRQHVKSVILAPTQKMQAVNARLAQQGLSRMAGEPPCASHALQAPVLHLLGQ